MWYIIAGCFLVTACTGESLYADIADSPSLRIKRQHQQQPQEPNYNYKPYNQAPDAIKQLLQLQSYREPLIHIPAHAPQSLQHAAAPAPQPRPAQYTPKVAYGQAPQQPTYKAIQPAAPARVPAPHYQPQYKTQYNPQYQQPQPQPNAIYRPEAARPPAGLSSYASQPQPQLLAQAPQYQPAAAGNYQPEALGQFPKGVPPHIQKIIESQRAYQGGIKLDPSTRKF